MRPLFSDRSATNGRWGRDSIEDPTGSGDWRMGAAIRDIGVLADEQAFKGRPHGASIARVMFENGG